MSHTSKFFYTLFALFTMCGTQYCHADNQTPDVSPIFPEDSLPFRVAIEQANFTLPVGLQSFASAQYKGNWLIIAGRLNGLHNFNNDNNNFPPDQQNTSVFVVNPVTGAVFSRPLNDPSSGLTQAQIDSLSVTAPQFYQTKKKLYMCGGYGVDTATGTFGTKDTFTAIDIQGLMNWVVIGSQEAPASQYIRQISDPIFAVTGGSMFRGSNNYVLLMLGQNYETFYLPSINGIYTRQIRRFKLHDNGKNLKIIVQDPTPTTPNENFRRRDLNIIPIMHRILGTPLPGYVALSGVFTPSFGIWTVPILMDSKGNPSMANPLSPTTFKQGMNNYKSACLGMFSKKRSDMYMLLFGGISYGFFQNGVFTTDSGFPFINQVTTVVLDKDGNFSQYIMSAAYPEIPSTGSNPGNLLLFGTSAQFFPLTQIDTFDNGVIQYDRLKPVPQVLGYIVGGIMSTLPNTNTSSDSAASPYVFKVVLTPLPEPEPDLERDSFF